MKKLGYSALFLIISYCISIDLFALGETRQIAASFTLAPENAAPNQPIILQPLDNTTGISIQPTLQVSVSDPNSADNLDVSFYGRVAGTTPGADFTMVLIPDPQNESQYYPAVFTSMTDWIVSQKSAMNIVFVTTTGDMVNHASSTTEYDNVDRAIDKLDPAGIPYSIGVGNHDQPTTNFNTYFGISRFSGKTWYGGHYGSTNDNSYSLFSASGMKFLLINLEINPSSAILDWADALLKANPDHRGIVESHSILNIDNSWTNNGIYNALKDNPNLFLMLCGHMHSASDGAAYRSESGDDGHTIHIMLADYQEFPNGGNGYMRILRFSPAADKIYATTYSPYINGSITSTANYDQMEMAYDMEGNEDSYTLIGTVNDVTNGGTASVTWTERAFNTEYEWYATVSDGINIVTGSTWSFTTNNTTLPSTFNVIGGGSYCLTNGGLPVGLANSEVGVTYTLYKSTIAQTPTVAGTGASISFGNQTAGTYTVSGTNGEGTTNMQGSAIIMESPTPQAPSVSLSQPTCGSTTGTITITAPTGAGMTYSINGSTYTNTSGIFTTVAVGTYNITAKNSSGCVSAGTSVTLNANPRPPAPTVTLTQPTCGSTTGTITITAPTGAGMTYSINGSTYTNTSGIFTSVASGTYSVTARNSTGCISSGISVVIVDQPDTPTTPMITSNGNILHSNAIEGNQWYNESGSINGATGQDFTPSSGGKYYVIVSNGLCSSNASNIIYFIPTSIEQVEMSNKIYLYPNPTDGRVTLSINGENPGNIIIEVFNLHGQTVKVEMLEVSENQTELDLEGLPKGTYYVKIIISGNSVIRTIILH